MVNRVARKVGTDKPNGRAWASACQGMLLPSDIESILDKVQALMQLATAQLHLDLTTVAGSFSYPAAGAKVLYRGYQSSPSSVHVTINCRQSFSEASALVSGVSEVATSMEIRLFMNPDRKAEDGEKGR